MAYLVQSLVNLRAEIDQRWPNRDRRTDGWLWGNPGYSVGHSPDEKGAVHAIDVDSDGVNGDWIVGNIYKGGDVLYYVIWNRRIYGRWSGFASEPYYGFNPHTDHLHIEGYRTWQSENYAGRWNIAAQANGVPVFGPAPGAGGYGETDVSPHINATGAWLSEGGNYVRGWASMIKGIRQ